MSSYPVLKNRPIDQWKVTELKDELRKRKLPVKGLKEELVRRLFDSIQSEEPEDEAVEDVGANALVNQAPEQQSFSQKTTVSLTEVRQETVVHVTQEATRPLAEVFTVLPVEKAPDYNVVAAHESSLSEAPIAKGDETESVAGENSTVQEGHPHVESNTEPVVQKTPEVVTNVTIVVDDVNSADFKSDMSSSEFKSDATEASKIEKQDTSPTPVDAVTSDADPMDTDVAAASVRNDGENLVPKNGLGDSTSIYDQECKDSELMNEDCKPIVSKPNNQN